MIRIAAVGDVALSGRIAEAIRVQGDAWLLTETGDGFRGIDVTLFNLEMPFALEHFARPPHVPETFRGDPSLVAALAFPGVRIAGIANNHIMDFGQAGLECTQETLRGAGILFGGAGRTPEEARRPVETKVKGVRIGVLAYAAEGPHSVSSRAGAAVLRPEEVLEDVKSLRPRVEVLIVQLHKGLNYVELPSPEDRAFFRHLATAGADLVLGHHPHVLQGTERIGRSFIAFSLGEFVFDDTSGNVVARFATTMRKRSAIMTAEVSSAGVGEARLVPVILTPEGRPRMPSGSEANRLVEHLADLDTLLQREDYENAFQQCASRSLVGHETRVLLAAVRRGDYAYLRMKLARLRWHHLRYAARNLLHRVLAGRKRSPKRMDAGA